MRLNLFIGASSQTDIRSTGLALHIEKNSTRQVPFPFNPKTEGVPIAPSPILIEIPSIP